MVTTMIAKDVSGDPGEFLHKKAQIERLEWTVQITGKNKSLNASIKVLFNLLELQN